jgi:hypothetical protein
VNWSRKRKAPPSHFQNRVERGLSLSHSAMVASQPEGPLGAWVGPTDPYARWVPPSAKPEQQARSQIARMPPSKNTLSASSVAPAC